MYAIYEADGGAEGRLALFDEDARRDEDLIDLGEAVELFRQMRDERPEEFERIISLRDGIRAARRPVADHSETYDARSAERGIYVFCRAGGYQRFYLVDDDSGDVKDVSTQHFLHALRCEPEEDGLPLPGGYNSAVSAATRRFREYLGKVRTERRAQPDLPRAQKYVVRELRNLYAEIQTDERREKIERLEETFRLETNTVVRRELNRIHRAQLSGDDLINALEQLYSKYRLGEERRETEERRRRAEADLTPRVVCSEAVL